MRSQLESLSLLLHAHASAALQGAVLGAVVLTALYPIPVQSGRLTNYQSAVADNTSHDVRRKADFGSVNPSEDARAVADWIARMDNSRGQAFFIIDKKAAQLYVFNARAQLQATSAVLLGAALGDDSVPGIGDRPIEQVRPQERTTPAGRFVAERGRNARGEDVVWVDYDAAVSIHRVVTANAPERRLERLATLTAADNRISYGCVNVPAAFYDAYIRPAFATQTNVVYVLPDVATIQQRFGF